LLPAEKYFLQGVVSFLPPSSIGFSSDACLEAAIFFGTEDRILDKQ
jgi:hypothetical protein